MWSEAVSVRGDELDEIPEIRSDERTHELKDGGQSGVAALAGGEEQCHGLGRL